MNFSSCPRSLWAKPIVSRALSGCLVTVEPTDLPGGRGRDPLLLLPAGLPTVPMGTGPPDCRQAETFDLTLSAPGTGLLLGLQWNNLNSTWRTKLLIKWNQTSFPRSKGKISEWSICTFNEAETFCPGTSDTWRQTHWEDEGARKGRKCVFKVFFFLEEKNMKKERKEKGKLAWIKVVTFPFLNWIQLD